MKSFRYNDIKFFAEKAKNSWDVKYTKPDGTTALVGTGLFEGLGENEIEDRATQLVQSIFPVGIKLVGPDVMHPLTVGDLKIVLPDVAHPNFIHWNKNSSSFSGGDRNAD